MQQRTGGTLHDLGCILHGCCTVELYMAHTSQGAQTCLMLMMHLHCKITCCWRQHLHVTHGIFAWFLWQVGSAASMHGCMMSHVCAMDSSNSVRLMYCLSVSASKCEACVAMRTRRRTLSALTGPQQSPAPLAILRRPHSCWCCVYLCMLHDASFCRVLRVQHIHASTSTRPFVLMDICRHANGLPFGAPLLLRAAGASTQHASTDKSPHTNQSMSQATHRLATGGHENTCWLAPC